MQITVQHFEPKPFNWWIMIAIISWLITVIVIYLWLIIPDLEAKEISPPTTLTASWYSIASLKKEGTYKYSKGTMANGKEFKDENFTCATWLYPLGSILRVFYIRGTDIRSVVVTVTDRIGKRFAKTRIDLSKRAFSQIANLEQGIVSVEVERIK